MSTTTFCLVSFSRKKATSTTKVAPCMLCAGPKNGSGRLWAIMIRSRTSTAYIGNLLDWSGNGIADDWGETVRAGGKDARQAARCVLECDLLGHQRVERGIVRAAAGPLPCGGDSPSAAGGRRRHVPDLRGDELQAPAVEGAAEVACDTGLSPYQLISTIVALETRRRRWRS